MWAAAGIEPLPHWRDALHRAAPSVLGGAGAATGVSAMRVGVAMAVYEPDEGYLRQQVDSMRAQVGVTWTAHVVDDASSRPLVRAHPGAARGRRPLRARTGPPVNLGSVGAFGEALRHVAAESVDAVALADQDDVWHPERLAATAAALGPDVAAVHSDLRLIDGEGAVIADSVWRRERRWTTTDLRRTVFRNSVTGCALTVRPDVLDLALPLPERPRPAPYHHDAWLTLHALRLGAVRALERPLVDYRAHGSNVVGVAQTGLVAVAAASPAAPWRRRCTTPWQASGPWRRTSWTGSGRGPCDPDEYDDVAASVGLFVGSGTFADHRALLAQTRGNADLTRRLVAVVRRAGRRPARPASGVIGSADARRHLRQPVRHRPALRARGG